MKSLLHRYAQSDKKTFGEAPSVYTYETIPWIEKNTLAYDRYENKVVQIPQYAESGIRSSGSLLTTTVSPTHHERLQLLFNPKLKIAANNNIFTLDTSDIQRVKNKEAPLETVFGPSARVGFKVKEIIPGSLDELRTTLRQFEKYNESNGWTLDRNPFFWRYFFDFVMLVGDIGDSSGSLLRALGMRDGRVYNAAYQAMVLDWVIKNHRRMGDHAIALAALIVSYINFDPPACREFLNEINSHHNRRKLTFEERKKLLRDLREIAVSTSSTNKSLAFQAKLLERRNWKLHEKFFSLLFLNDEGIQLSDEKKQFLKELNPGLNWRERDRAAEENHKTAMKHHAYAMTEIDNFHSYLDALPDPLILYKGGTLFSTERVRKGKGGRVSEDHRKISDAHLKRIGVSFTTNPLIAEWFATKSTYALADGPLSRSLPEGKLRPVVVRYSIPKSEVFLPYNLRSESEVLIHNERALTVVDYEFCNPSVTVDSYNTLVRHQLDELVKMRLEDPSLQAARKRSTSYTSYPNRDNVIPVLHPMIFGMGWVDNLKLHKKFAGGCYAYVYENPEEYI